MSPNPPGNRDIARENPFATGPSDSKFGEAFQAVAVRFAAQSISEPDLERACTDFPSLGNPSVLRLALSIRCSFLARITDIRPMRHLCNPAQLSSPGTEG
jgi:hypothetical protein